MSLCVPTHRDHIQMIFVNRFASSNELGDEIKIVRIDIVVEIPFVACSKRGKYQVTKAPVKYQPYPPIA